MAGLCGMLIAIAVEPGKFSDQAGTSKNNARPPRPSLPRVREGALF